MFNFNRSKGTIDKPCQFSISIRSMYLAFSLDAVKLKENLVSRQQVVTDSGKLDWNCWSYPPRLVFPLFLARRPPFVLYSTSHPSVMSRHRRQAWFLCTKPRATILPPMKRPLWHTDLVLTRPISVSLLPTMLNVFYSFKQVFLNNFIREAFLFPLDRSTSVTYTYTRFSLKK